MIYRIDWSTGVQHYDYTNSVPHEGVNSFELRKVAQFVYGYDRRSNPQRLSKPFLPTRGAKVDLENAWHQGFMWVFQRNDLFSASASGLKKRIKRRSPSTAGRTADKYDAFLLQSPIYERMHVLRNSRLRASVGEEAESDMSLPVYCRARTPTNGNFIEVEASSDRALDDRGFARKRGDSNLRLEFV